MKHGFLFPLIFVPYFLCGQQSNHNGISKLHLDKIRKNIEIYRIKESDLSFNICYDSPMFFINRVVPYDPYEIHLEFQKANFNFPDESFSVYKIINPKGQWFNPKNNSYLKNTNSIDGFYENKFLIAIKDKEIIYISGSFYKSCISKYFKELDIKNPTTFKNLIRFKLFNLGIKNIEHIRTNRKFILFRAEAEFFDKMCAIKVKIDKNNFENVIVDNYPCSNRSD